MAQTFDFLGKYLIVIIAFLLALDIFLIVLFFLLNAKIRSIFKGSGSLDLEKVLLYLQVRDEVSKNEIETLKKRLEIIEEELPKDIRRVGLVRYNPFSDTGGDQSFALALLDEHKNGVVISSLYGREMNRVYAKRIEKGGSAKHQLTEEEKQAIEQAVTG